MIKTKLQNQTLTSRIKSLAIPTLKGGAIPRILLVVVLALAVVLGMYQLTPPTVVPASAPATEFSAERAMSQLRVIAAQPHPMGSPAHAVVEQYLINQLTAMGLKPEVQSTTGIGVFEYIPGLETVYAGRVHNILARIPGTANTGAILLSGTYDSVPTTPGASDPGSGPATILETVRALRAGPPLRNDIIVFFQDADVVGILGAKAFVEEHPWAKDSALAMSFWGIGNQGPSLLVYTSPENGWLMEETIRAAPHPLTYSYLTDATRAMGIGGDMPDLAKAGIRGLVFSAASNIQVYHTALDNTQAIDPRTIQHHGSYALALTRHFGNLPLTQTSAPDEVAFNILPDKVVHYSTAWVLPLTALVALFFAGVVTIGFRRNELTGGGMAIGVVAFFGALLGSVLLTSLIWKAIIALNPNYHIIMQGMYHSEFYLLSFIALTVSVVTAVYLALRSRIRAYNLAIGALLWWLLFTLLISLVLPGMSYALTWPLLFALLVMGWMLLSGGLAAHPWAQAAGLATSAVPAVMLFAPMLYLLYELALRSDFAHLATVPYVGIVVLFAALLIGILLPHVEFLAVDPARTAAPWWWLVPILAALLGIGFIAAGTVTSGFSVDQPRPDHIAYMIDGDTGKANWYSIGDQVDDWTAQFFRAGSEKTQGEASPGYFAGQIFPALKAAAPEIPLAAPNVSVLEDRRNGDVRTLHLRLFSPRGASAILLQLTVPGEIIGMTLDGKPVNRTGASADKRNRLHLLYFAPSSEGAELTLDLNTTGPINLTVTDFSNGLPEIPGMTIAPRPPDTMPEMFDFADPTSVSKSLTLPP